MRNVLKFLKEIKVYDCDLTKTRIGSKNDGGYVALKELCENTDTLYTFGVENDVGFELDFVNRFQDSNVKLFDPTIERLPDDHERFQFFKLGVGPDHVALDDIMLGAAVPGNMMLKMDIEWDEWGTIISADSRMLRKFDQILIEFHIVPIDHVEESHFSQRHFPITPYFRNFYNSVHDKISDSLFEMYYEVIRKLNKQFYAFHIHPNNSLRNINAGGFSFPPLLELSFVRKDLVGNARIANGPFPVEGLDFRNKADRNDVGLGDILKL